MNLLEAILMHYHSGSPLANIRVGLPVQAKQNDIKDLRAQLKISNRWEVAAQEVRSFILQLIL